MNWLVQALSQFSIDTSLHTDIQNVMVTFCAAGLFFLVLFTAQIFLIHQIEQSHFFRPRGPRLRMFRRLRPGRDRRP
jgi:hypothetical protein